MTAALHDADLGDARFDKILAVHFPPLLRGRPRRELDKVRAHLAPGGALYVVTQPHVAERLSPRQTPLRADWRNTTSR